MRKHDEWGDHITLQVAANMFGLKVCILNQEGQDTIVKSAERSNDLNHIYLGHIVEKHYVSLVPSGLQKTMSRAFSVYITFIVQL